MMVNFSVESVLPDELGELTVLQAGSDAYVVPVRPTHLQTAISAEGRIETGTVTGDVLEAVAATPMTWTSLTVSFQRIRLLEIVPRAKDLNYSDGSR